MIIPLEIDRYLTDNGIRQNYLSKKSGLSENAICLTLCGKRRLLADEYVKICNALGVPYDKFISKQN